MQKRKENLHSRGSVGAPCWCCHHRPWRFIKNLTTCHLRCCLTLQSFMFVRVWPCIQTHPEQCSQAVFLTISHFFSRPAKKNKKIEIKKIEIKKMEIKKMKFRCMYRMFHMGPTATKPCYFWPHELRVAVSCVCAWVGLQFLISFYVFVWDRSEHMEPRNPRDGRPAAFTIRSNNEGEKKHHCSREYRGFDVYTL